jgi:diadenosine tetraphosphate (Ap4A) HIT family hydrolase
MLVPGCLSCDIVAGKRASPGGTIYEDEHWHVDSVAGPVYWPGFLIVKLKRHCEHLAELTPEEAAALGPMIQTTCAALTAVLKPAKVYVCSFGDGVKHVHFWVLPRPPRMRPGMHWVMFHLDLRGLLTRRFGVNRWVCSEQEVAELVSQVRAQFHQLQRADRADA